MLYMDQNHKCRYDTEREELMKKCRELDEVKTRAAQMEKTMKWWSECTTNWREKWANVRTERNKLRDDLKQFQLKYNQISKDYDLLQLYNKQLQNEFEQFRMDSMKKGDLFDEKVCESHELKCPEHKKDSLSWQTPTLTLNKLLEQLDEAKKSLLIEKKENARLQEQVDILTNDIERAKTMHGNLEKSKLNLFECDDSTSDKKFDALKLEMEKMQITNATEWEKRDHLDLEMKNLNSLCTTLNDNLETSNKEFSICKTVVNQLQISDREQNERICDLEEKFSKLQNIITEKLNHGHSNTNKIDDVKITKNVTE